MQASTVQTGNLAAQLNDIGVQLAGGQSPFLIALQQGTQITQALGSGVGARGAVAALGGAFTSLLNPVSLATIAIIALGGTAIQYFSDLISGSDDSNKKLEEQAKLIQAVADRWGDAVPALRDYADEVKRTQDLASLNEGVKIVNEKTLEDVRVAISNSRAELSALVTDLQQAEEPEVVKAFQAAFQEFAASAEDGSLKVEQVNRVQDALAAAINSQGIPALADFRKLLDDVSASALGAAGSVQKVQQAAAGARLTADNLPALGTLTPLESVNGQITGDSMAIQNARAEATKSETQLAAEKAAAKEGRRGSGARDKAAKDAEREKQAVADLIDQLEFEQSLIGMTSAERAEANALRRVGAAATDEQRAKITQLVDATYAEREAIKNNEEAMRSLQDASRDVLQGIVSDLREGKSGADILAGALDKIADRLLDSAFDGLFGGSGGAAAKGGLFGGAIIPGILHDGGVAGSDGYGHGRAVSSKVFSGAKRYHTGGIAGLQPGEVPAILQRGEIVIPKGMRAGGGSAPSFTFAPSYNVQGSGPEIADLRAQMARDKADFSAKVVQTVQRAKKTRDL
jgi:hypothetical protein